MSSGSDEAARTLMEQAEVQLTAGAFEEAVETFTAALKLYSDRSPIAQVKSVSFGSTTTCRALQRSANSFIRWLHNIATSFLN